MASLSELTRYGQAIWYDNFDRGLIASGKLKKLISEGITGITTNPTILEKALQNADYNSTIQELISRGEREAEKIYETLVFEDVRMAAELLLPVFEQTGGRDGFVSIEVSPKFAYDTEATVWEAKRIFKEINHPNILIKVPATEPGLKAIEELIYQGVNVNATLVFSQKHYQGAAQAYLSGLERRLAEGKPLKIASVASFFVSRIDTAVDKLLEKAPHLKGKTAIAYAKKIYQLFKQIFSSPRFLVLKEKGAWEQKLVWASTSTKNPLYSDVLYVEELIGPQTINTIPEVTLIAFKDHGKTRASLQENLEEAEHILEELRQLGINLEEVAESLQREGVEAFARSYDKLLENLRLKASNELLESAK